MGVRCPTINDYLKRTTSLIAASVANRTVMGWFKSDATDPNNVTIWVAVNDPAVYTQYAGLFGVGSPSPVSITLDMGNPPHFNRDYTPWTLGKWYHVCWTKASNTQALYINGRTIGSGTFNISAFTFGFELLGGDTTGSGGPTIAYFREWTTGLNNDQIISEMQATAAVTTGSLWGDWPLGANGNDISGNGRHWTSVGSPVFDASAVPTWPSNSTAALATNIVSLPYDVTTPFGDGIEAWFRRTALAGEVIEGMFGTTGVYNADDNINLDVYTGAPGALALYQTALGSNTAFQVPVTPGTTYYMRVRAVSGQPSKPVEFSVLPGPTTFVPAGAIYVNDDAAGFPTAAIPSDASGDFVPYQYFSSVRTQSENGGDVLANGTSLLADDTNLVYKVFDNQLTYVKTVAGLVEEATTAVRTCVGTQAWFVAKKVAHTISRVASDGTLGTVWDLGAGNTPTAIAAKNDESIIYVVINGNTLTGRAVKQWNTAGSVFGADLVAGLASNFITDLLVLGDGTLIVLYVNGTNVTIKAFDGAGTLLHTYSYTTLDSQLNQSLFHALDDPTTFWVRTHDKTVLGTSVCLKIQVATGAVLATATQASYEAGASDVGITAAPLARFGVSHSCPAFQLRAAIGTPASGAAVYTIRRVRRFPHQSDRQLRQFCSRLLVVLESGMGLSSGQGSDPIVMLRYSDDGGHTWSGELVARAGKMGEFRTQVQYLMLGSYRDRVWEISVSDPTKWAAINAFVDVEAEDR